MGVKYLLNPPTGFINLIKYHRNKVFLAKEKQQKIADHHYKGHRDRLRQRFLNGGAEALQDYEMLELIIFLAIPRRDVKPMAKDLIKKFGDLSGVLSADRDYCLRSKASLKMSLQN